MEELGIEYALEKHLRDPRGGLAPASLKAAHGLGRAPVITDGEFSLAESGAIITYLIEQYSDGTLVPSPGADAYWHYHYWLHFAEGSLMPPVLLRAIFDKMVDNAPAVLIRPILKRATARVMTSYLAPGLERNLTYIESHLRNNLWFAGEQLSGADFQMIFPLETIVWRGIDRAAYPGIVDFVARVHARPAYQRALTKGGEYAYL